MESSGQAASRPHLTAAVSAFAADVVPFSPSLCVGIAALAASVCHWPEVGETVEVMQRHSPMMVNTGACCVRTPPNSSIFFSLLTFPTVNNLRVCRLQSGAGLWDRVSMHDAQVVGESQTRSAQAIQRTSVLERRIRRTSYVCTLVYSDSEYITTQGAVRRAHTQPGDDHIDRP